MIRHPKNRKNRVQLVNPGYEHHSQGDRGERAWQKAKSPANPKGSENPYDKPAAVTIAIGVFLSMAWHRQDLVPNRQDLTTQRSRDHKTADHKKQIYAGTKPMTAHERQQPGGVGEYEDRVRDEREDDCKTSQEFDIGDFHRWVRYWPRFNCNYGTFNHW